MSFLKDSALVGTLALISKVSAHGIVTGIIADGVYFQGYDPSFEYQQTPPKVAGWTAPLTMDRGFVSDYTSPDIICHKSATPGESYVQVSAGSTIELQWSQWPESHHGPMLDYLAPCGADCTTVDKTALQWTKIDEAGLVSGGPSPGHWASDDMIANNNSWVTTIPSSIAPGKYVLRHETIALHAAHEQGGAQNYPQCMNIEVSGSGSDGIPSGTLGTDLYTANDPGIFLNIYYPPLSSYDIPGPPVYSGAGSNPQPSDSASASTSASASASESKPADITDTPTSNIAAPTDIVTETKETDVTVTAGPSPTYGSGEGDSEGSDPPPSGRPAGGTDTPAPSEAPSPTQGSPSAPASFSSTVTGRIRKPTKFVCYVEED